MALLSFLQTAPTPPTKKWKLIAAENPILGMSLGSLLAHIDLQHAENCLESNKSMLANLTFDLLARIRALGFDPQEAWLKAVSTDFFELMIGVPSKDFFDEGFIKAYEEAGKTEDIANADTWLLSISFTSLQEQRNDVWFLSEGFHFRLLQQA